MPIASNSWTATTRWNAGLWCVGTSQNLVDCPAAITAALSHPPPFTTRSAPLPPDRLVPLPPRPLPAGAGAVPRGHRRLPDGPAAATQQHAGPRRHDDASPVLLHEGWPTSSPPQPPPPFLSLPATSFIAFGWPRVLYSDTSGMPLRTGNLRVLCPPRR